MTKLLLLDSNSLINRAFYALPPMTTKDGLMTNAAYGYLSMLARMIEEISPTHIGAVFDRKAPTFRHLMYDGYKATRKGMPDELAAQLPVLKELLCDLGVKILEQDGYEADDIIGTLAKRFDIPTVIVSGDKDVLQLVDRSTTVYHTRRGVTDIKIYDLDAMEQEGLTPRQIIEYKALAGDTSDNIPGAPGVGAKTAMQLLHDFGDLDTLYQRIGELKGKLKEKLQDNKDLVYLSQKLATIDTDAPVDCTLEALRFVGGMPQAFAAKLMRYEMKSLIPRFGKGSAAQEGEAEEAPSATSTIAESALREIESTEELAAILREATELSVSFGKEIRFAVDALTEYRIVPNESLLDDGVDFDAAVEAFRLPMQSEACRKVLFDVKSTMRFLKGYGITVCPPYDDVMLMQYLVDSNRVPKDAFEMASSYGISDRTAAPLFGIAATLSGRLVSDETERLYREIELPLIAVLFEMENHGFTVDRAELERMSEEFGTEIKRLTEEIYAAAGTRFNINSPKQLGQILFEHLGLPSGKKTKTGYSVAADVLEELDHPVVSLILQYRRWTKLQSTYLDGMRSVLGADGKVHTVFKQCLTATGRLSSTEPNLQNIPIRYPEGRKIRKMFIPSPGNVLVSADYSQIELRLLTHFSGDPVLTEAYRENRDIHAITAAKINDVAPENVTSEMRRAAKAVNFGMIYGISAFGLSRDIGISPYQARLFQEKYFATYPNVKAYMDANVRFAKEHGYVVSLAGRRRYFPELTSPNRNIRNFGERAAMNMPLQGSASDIVKIAMIKVDRALKEGNYRAALILQVHDELILDVPEEEAEAVKILLRENMENAVTLKVPLIAEAKSGKNWYVVE